MNYNKNIKMAPNFKTEWQDLRIYHEYKSLYNKFPKDNKILRALIKSGREAHAYFCYYSLIIKTTDHLAFTKKLKIK